MFCPQCKSEYQEGVVSCADCKVALVPSLESELEPEFIEYEKVLSTCNPMEIGIIKSVLASEGIIYFFQGENANHLFPVAFPATLMVCKEQVPEAKKLLAAVLENNLPEDP